MDFANLRLRTLEEHAEYIKHELARGEYVIKLSWGGAHFCKPPSDNKTEPVHCLPAPFADSGMFLAAVRQLEINRELVRINGPFGEFKGQTLWYCLELLKAQAVNAA